jgi:methylmalonyl-CoA mutase C-terminal domain/subunit
MRPPRVLLAKPGLDGHDRGIKVIAMALRDAGAEVIYLGLRVTAGQIVRAATDEDADLIGISSLSGAHLPIAEQLLAAMTGAGLDTPLVIGGTIPPGDVAVLRSLGVAGVFPVGTPLPRVVEGVLALAGSQAAA